MGQACVTSACLRIILRHRPLAASLQSRRETRVSYLERIINAVVAIFRECEEISSGFAAMG